jgi:hypothetical protein
MLLFAAVSYVAALRAARGRQMRTGLLPGAVDRHLTRQRNEAVRRVRRKFNRPVRDTRGTPPSTSSTGSPPDSAPVPPPVDPEAPTAP